MKIVEREMSSAEFEQMKVGFTAHTTESGNPPISAERLTFVATNNDAFVGTASGLLYKGSSWFYLTDLFIEKPYRGKGLGSQLLTANKGVIFRAISARYTGRWSGKSAFLRGA